MYKLVYDCNTGYEKVTKCEEGLSFWQMFFALCSTKYQLQAYRPSGQLAIGYPVSVVGTEGQVKFYDTIVKDSFTTNLEDITMVDTHNMTIGVGRKVRMFSKPNCPNCLEREISLRSQGYTVRVKYYDLSQIERLAQIAKRLGIEKAYTAYTSLYAEITMRDYVLPVVMGEEGNVWED